MNKRRIELGLGILAFIVGFIFLSIVSWLINTESGEVTIYFLRAVGSWSLIGLALISLGVIVILLVKFEK